MHLTKGGFNGVPQMSLFAHSPAFLEPTGRIGQGDLPIWLANIQQMPIFHLHPCLYPCSQASTSWVRSSLETKVLSRMLLGGAMGEESLFCFWPYSLPCRQMSLISEPVCSSLAGICPSGISRFYLLHQAKSVSFQLPKLQTSLTHFGLLSLALWACTPSLLLFPCGSREKQG